MERLAAKTTYAADLLENSVQVAECLEKLQARVTRYVCQAQLVVTWRRGQGIAMMAGSMAKSVGGALVLAAPLHPKLSLTVKTAQRLWKLGTGLKVLTVVGSVLREMWQSGCRDTLIEFTRCVALLTSRVNTLQECIVDLRQVNSNMNNGLRAPQEMINIMSEFISPGQLGYATHVINMVYGNTTYSPLFDFALSSTNTSGQYNVIQVIQEIEGFNFSEFAGQSDAKALVAIGGFLHISRELMDFLDGFHRVTDQDCRFLSECLSKFTEESVSIMKVASLITGMYRVSKDGQMLPQATQSHSSQNLMMKSNLSTSSNDQGILTSNKCRNENDLKDDLIPEQKSDQIQACESKEYGNSSEEVHVSSNRQFYTVNKFINKSEIFSSSLDFMKNGLLSVLTVVGKGSSLVSSTVNKKRLQSENSFNDTQYMDESQNQI